MPIRLISIIKPQNNADIPMVEDIDMLGGYRTVPAEANLTDSTISANHRKAGMFVKALSQGTFWTLNNDLSTWTQFVGGTSTVMHQQLFTATSGQTSFVLSFTPLSQQATELFIDGISQTISIDYTVTGSTVTYSGYPALTGGEQVVVKYFQSLSAPPDSPGLSSVLGISNTAGGLNIDLQNTSKIVNAQNPVNPQDVATKDYVDAAENVSTVVLAQKGSVPTLSNGINYVVCCVVTSGGGFSITLPATPTVGQNITIKDVARTIYLYGNVTILPNAGQTIDGQSSIVLNVNNMSYTLVYVGNISGSGYQWAVI